MGSSLGTEDYKTMTFAFSAAAKGLGSDFRTVKDFISALAGFPVTVDEKQIYKLLDMVNTAIKDLKNPSDFQTKRASITELNYCVDGLQSIFLAIIKQLQEADTQNNSSHLYQSTIVDIKINLDRIKNESDKATAEVNKKMPEPSSPPSPGTH